MLYGTGKGICAAGLHSHCLHSGRRLTRKAERLSVVLSETVMVNCNVKNKSGTSKLCADICSISYISL